MVVVRADVVPQVGGATGHPEGGGTEEARAEWACVRRSRGGWGRGVQDEGMEGVEVWRVLVIITQHAFTAQTVTTGSFFVHHDVHLCENPATAVWGNLIF